MQAYDRWDIPNSIDPDPSPGYVALARQTRQPWLQMATQLGPPTGRYNCHGLVFASRRTNIPPQGMPDAVDIDVLLWHDNYEQVTTPQVGDIVVYRRQKEIEHTGIVCEVITANAASGLLPAVFVWSMWGGLGEFRHRVTACPYAEGCAMEYWRLRL